MSEMDDSGDRKPKPWDYLEDVPAADAPPSDNPSNLYCPSCRATGMFHCASPEWCGGMRRMQVSEEKTP